MVNQEMTLAHDLNKRIFPIRVNYDGALPYDLGAYLDKIQYKLWRLGDPFDVICGAIVDELRNAEPRAPTQATEQTTEALHLLSQATEAAGAPLPSADPRLETGAIKLDSPYYVERPEDQKAVRSVTQPGETILVKGPRQVGKTSLAARARAAAERNNQLTSYIDFQLIDEARLRDDATLLKYLAARLAKDLRTSLKPAEIWDENLGQSDSLTDFLEAVLVDIPDATPVVVCFDEVDNIFSHSYRDSFFGMLRGWHNRRATRPVWNRFNLVIAHSTEPALFIRDLNQSPFNIGTVLRLGDFNRDQVRFLNSRHGSPLKGSEELERLISLIGGYPYLVRQALYAMSSEGISITQLEATSADDRGPFGDHLRRHMWLLRENERLRKALKQVIDNRSCADEDDFQRLRAAGLIKGESRQSAVIRCDLYSRYMRPRL
jgi:hypothetical protein